MARQNTWLNRMAGGLATLAAAAALYLGPLEYFYYHRDDSNFEAAFRKVYSAKTEDELVEGSKDLSKLMEKRGWRELAFDGESVSTPYGIETKGVTIARQDSTVLVPYTSQMDQKSAETFGKNVRYVVATDNFARSDVVDEADGLSIGGGVVLLRTGYHGTPREAKTMPSTLGHEGKHEETRPKSFSRLRDEGEAHAVGAEVLRHQLKSQPNDLLSAYLHDREKRVETATFLQKYGEDFADVYPPDVMLARDFLRAGISAETLNKYSSPCAKGKNNLEDELGIAAYVSGMVRSLPRDEAIEWVYKTLMCPANKNTLFEANLASALSYLCPDIGHVEWDSPTGSGKERVKVIEFGRKNTSVKGNPKGPQKEAKDPTGPKFGVSGLPSMEELLGDKRAPENYKPNEAEKGPITRYGFWPGDTVLKREERDGTRLVLYPQKEGEPEEGFKFFEVVFGDHDSNGNPGSHKKYLRADKIKNAQGKVLLKEDSFLYIGEKTIYKGSRLLFAWPGQSALDIEEKRIRARRFLLPPPPDKADRK